MTSTDRTTAIVEMRRSGDTLKEIGDRFDITPQRVQQICKQYAPDLFDGRNWKAQSAKRRFASRYEEVINAYRDGNHDLYSIAQQTSSSVRFVRTTLERSGDIEERSEPWSEAVVVSAMMRWYDERQDWPRSHDWITRGEWWPCRATVVTRFGWSRCLDEAKRRMAMR
jgi:hypothetical protein